MTSLIFGSIYMTHQGVMEHRRQKKRQKNYERWEDLRDEYDAQKKITRETRSLDIQRTGAWDNQAGYFDGGNYTARDERPILTLRDQQEANDARLSWRPQEMWEEPHSRSNNPFEMAPQRTASVPAIPPHLQQQPTAIPAYLQQQPTAIPPYLQPQATATQSQPHLSHSVSSPSAYWQSRGEIRPQKTGAVWDDGLPTPLRVSRRSFEDYEYPARRGSAPVQDTQSQTPSRTNSVHQSRNVSNVPSRSQTPVSVESTTVPGSVDDLSAKIATFSVEPVQSHVPGGRMAELIERGY